jgi:ribosomal protein S18 acetylase RimI-like enzyme
VSLEVRRLRPEEWELLRAVRLRALADSPLAFGATHAQESALTEADWRERAARSGAGEEHVVFLAQSDGSAPSGMAMGALEDGDATLAHLWALWVAPEARGAGAATALIQAVAGWARARGRARLRASLADGNDAAARLYRRLRFAPTGERESLGHDGVMTAILMLDLR